MTRAYYNENDPYAAAWLRNLIDAGLIASGDVDERSIVDVRTSDLAGYTQCHWFAGIGGWSYALRLAGFPDDRECWTGSCPCQPLSSAGQRKGHADERHLWPAFYALIAERRPATVFGEQVASKDGREWLAGVRADLEALGYGVGAADLCAAGVGAPHIRQRLFWLADTAGNGQSRPIARSVHDAAVEQPEHAEGANAAAVRSERVRATGGSGDAGSAGLEGWRVSERGRSGEWVAWQTGGDAYWLPCTDGKTRRVEPGTFPLAHGVPARVGRLRGYGNAIVPQVAAEFIAAYLNV